MASSSSRARPTRKAKLQNVDYAVLISGLQVPEYSSEDENSSSDGGFGPKHKRKTRKRLKQRACLICHKMAVASALTQCDVCSRWYHWRCSRSSTSSSSVLGSASCRECLQESTIHSKPRPAIQSLAQVVQLLKKAKNILVLAGAGMSVSCGIPDFRSKHGLYAMVQHMDIDVPEPEALFQIDFFRQNPAPFFQLVRNVFADTPTPSATHTFLKMLQDRKKLLRVYSQNIDGLEAAAGVTKCVSCHGSFAFSRCMRCEARVPTSSLQSAIHAGLIPTCGEPGCRGGVLKPEITFFGELLSDDVSAKITQDRLRADLLLVIGTSLKVSPVAEIPGFLPQHIPQIVINMTPLKKKKKKKNQKLDQRAESSAASTDTGKEEEFDWTLLGDCDTITKYLSAQCGWTKGEHEEQEPQMAVHADQKRVCFNGCHCNEKLASRIEDAAKDEDDEDDGEEAVGLLVWCVLSNAAVIVADGYLADWCCLCISDICHETIPSVTDDDSSAAYYHCECVGSD